MGHFATETSLLCVEDNEITRQYLGTVLTLSFPAVTVVSAVDGVQGVELFRQHHPDLIITDLDMPRMNGMQMVVEIRTLGYAGEIIMMTARSEADLRGQLGRVGIDCFISKPILLRELLAAVAQRLPSAAGHKKAC